MRLRISIRGRVRPSVSPSVHLSIPYYFRTMSVFEAQKSSKDIMNNDTISDDEEVASYVAPRYLFPFRRSDSYKSLWNCCLPQRKFSAWNTSRILFDSFLNSTRWGGLVTALSHNKHFNSVWYIMIMIFGEFKFFFRFGFCPGSTLSWSDVTASAALHSVGIQVCLILLRTTHRPTDWWIVGHWWQFPFPKIYSDSFHEVASRIFT